MASGSAIQDYTVPASDISEVMAGIKVAVPQTEFKVGDVLRLTIFNTASTAGANIHMGHDPKSRLSLEPATYWTVTTATTAHFPFVIDI